MDYSEIHYEYWHCPGTTFYMCKFAEHDMYVNVHNDIEILYIIQGGFRLYVDDTLFELHSGDAFIINAGSVHFGIAEKHTIWVVFLTDWKWLNPMEGIDQDINRFYRLIHGELRIPPYIICEGDNDGLHEEILHIWHQFEKHQPGWKLQVIASYYKLAALFEAKGCLQENVSTPCQVPSERKNDISLYVQFTRYVHLHFSEALTIPTIAKELQVSESRLYKVCKKIQGYPPTRYILHYRLTRSAEMLRDSDKTVTNICYDCGFDNVSYFITRFRSHYGKTPSQFRTQNTEM